MENFSFWDTEVWGTFNLIAALLASLLIAYVLLGNVRFLKRSLIPPAVLGGILLLAFSVLYEKISGTALFETVFFGGKGTGSLEILTYHCLGLGFIASTLKPSRGSFSAERRREIFDSGVATVATYLIQGIFGLSITLAAAALIKGIFPAAGVILPFGYGQGTGQALNYGIIYENEHGFLGGRSFGLTIAAFGFLSASIGGVIHLNLLRRNHKGYDWERLEAARGRVPEEDCETKTAAPFGIDQLTVQLMLVGIGYLAACGLMTLFGLIVPGFKSLFFGLNYLMGVVAAILIKALIRGLMKKGCMKEQPVSPYLMSRISGFCFDLMIVSGIAAIRIHLLKDYWWLLILLGLVGAFATYFYDHFVSVKLFGAYAEEQFLMLYGMLTGTASTGIILLRQLDPGFRTPAADNMVYLNFPAIAFGFPMMLLAAVAPEQPLLTLGYMFLFFAALNLILFRRRLFKTHKA